jgi:hypothetical protein
MVKLSPHIRQVKMWGGGNRQSTRHSGQSQLVLHIPANPSCNTTGYLHIPANPSCNTTGFTLYTHVHTIICDWGRQIKPNFLFPGKQFVFPFSQCWTSTVPPPPKHTAIPAHTNGSFRHHDHEVNIGQSLREFRHPPTPYGHLGSQSKGTYTHTLRCSVLDSYVL